jgi:hypothetical protein
MPKPFYFQLKLFAGAVGGGVLANTISFVAWWLWMEGDLRSGLDVTALIVPTVLMVPFLVLGIWSLVQELSLEEAAHEKLKLISAFTALLVTIWLPLLFTIMAGPTTDGVVFALIFFLIVFISPLTIAYGRLTARTFTGVSCRLFGRDNNEQPRTLPTIATMLILHSLLIWAILFGLNALLFVVMKLRS